MNVFHPAQAINGIPPENVFYVSDSANQTVAQGYLIQTYHPYLFPERPINLFMNMQTQGPGRDMLMGALLARAVQLRESTPQYKARLYTQVNPQDAEMLRFYTENGFSNNDALDIVQIGVPNARQSCMGYDIGFLPLSNLNEMNAFLMRMNTYRLNSWTPEMLSRYRACPHFMVLYVSYGRNIIAEAAFTGEGSRGKLLGLYVVPEHRQKGFAKMLISYGMGKLSERGVTYVEADVIRRNVMQTSLARSCGAILRRTACIYPGINYD